MVIGCFACGSGPVDCSDWMRMDCAVDFSPGGVWIGYLRQELWDRSLTDVAPVTGSLVFSALLGCLDVYFAAGFTLCRTFCSMDCVLLAGFGLSLRRVSEYWTMATEGAALVENRAGITFGVELYVYGVESSVSIPDLSSLSQQWPPAVISHMGWCQQELEGMRAAAKQRFRQSRPSSCVYCGKVPFRLGVIVAVPSAMVHRVERHAPGLYGSRSGGGGGGRMMFRGTLNWPALNSFFRCGQFDVRCGRIP